VLLVPPKSHPAVTSLGDAKAAGNTSEDDVEEQLLSMLASGESLTNVPLPDVPPPDVALPES